MILMSLAYKKYCVVHDNTTFVNNSGLWVDNAGYKENVSSYSRQSGKIHVYDLYYNTVVGNFSVKIGGTVHFKTYTMSACN